MTNLLDYKLDSVGDPENLQLYLFINEINNILYIVIKINNFSLIQEFPSAGTFHIRIELTELSSEFIIYICTCLNTTKIDLSHLNMENVTTIESGFSNCENLKEINSGIINANKITDLNGAFYDCNKFEKL